MIRTNLHDFTTDTIIIGSSGSNRLWSFFFFMVMRFSQMCASIHIHEELNSLRPSDLYMRRYKYQHWFREWLVAGSAPSHYLHQCWNIVNWTLGNKLQWNFNRNSNIFIEENTFENVVCEMLPISSRPQWKPTRHYFAWQMIRILKPYVCKQ